jgi:hypothetical protein
VHNAISSGVHGSKSALAIHCLCHRSEFLIIVREQQWAAADVAEPVDISLRYAWGLTAIGAV